MRATFRAVVQDCVESYVNWCGHAQEVIPVPRADGLIAFVPVLGKAT